MDRPLTEALNKGWAVTDWRRIEQGQRVRVVLEGPVGLVDGLQRRFQLGYNVIWNRDVHVKSIEVLGDHEPEWLDGDVVLDGAGRIWHLVGKGWMTPGNFSPYPAAMLISPVTLLVRDGKPVTSG